MADMGSCSSLRSMPVVDAHSKTPRASRALCSMSRLSCGEMLVRRKNKAADPLVKGN
jgi:hypothetical protein